MDSPFDEIAKKLQVVEEVVHKAAEPTVQSDLQELVKSMKNSVSEIAALENEESAALAAYQLEVAAADREFAESLRVLQEEPETEAVDSPAVTEAIPDAEPEAAPARRPAAASKDDERYAFTDWVRESQSLIVPSESMAGAAAGSAVTESVVTPAEAEPIEVEKLGWSTWLQGTRGEAPAEDSRPATPEDQKRDGEWRKFLESDSR